MSTPMAKIKRTGGTHFKWIISFCNMVGVKLGRAAYHFLYNFCVLLFKRLAVPDKEIQKCFVFYKGYLKRLRNSAQDVPLAERSDKSKVVYHRVRWSKGSKIIFCVVIIYPVLDPHARITLRKDCRRYPHLPD